MTSPNHYFVTRLLVFGGLWALSACTPSLNWRQVQLPGLSYLSPCRVETQHRQVPWAGVSSGARVVNMSLSACDAGHATWAITQVEVPDAASVASALQAMRQAAADNVGDHAPAWASGAQGVTRLQGVRPNGDAVMVWVRWIAQRQGVIQASVVAVKDEPGMGQARAMFFSNLRVTQ